MKQRAVSQDGFEWARRLWPLPLVALVLSACGDPSSDRPAPAAGASGTNRASPPSGGGGRSGTTGPDSGDRDAAAGEAASVDGDSGPGAVPPADPEAGSSERGDGALGLPSETAHPGGPEGPDGGPGCRASDACVRYCRALETGPECAVEGSDVDECICDCERTIRADCGVELDALLDCAEDSLEVVCDRGAVIDERCLTESLDLELCEAEAAGFSCDASAACKAFCGAAVLARCPSGPSSLSACYCACQDKVEPACGMDLEALVDCAPAGLDVSCDTSGAVTVTGPACAGQWAAVGGCL